MHITVFAANSAEVYAETITATIDRAILIPVRIKNNSGIMGFKITVSYDKSVLTSPKVTKGSLTENGMMNDSIGVTPDGDFDVVWSGTRNEVGDGTLMILSFMAVDAKNTQIKLSYSQPDTFNEAWEDVELKCSDISVSFPKHTLELSTTAETEVVILSTSEKQPSGEEIKNAVDIAISETGDGNINEIPEEEKSEFVGRTNEILGQLAGGTNKPFENIEEIKVAYENAVAEKFVDDTKDAVDSDKIDVAINDSLVSVGAESVEKIPEEKKAEFVRNLESNIAQYAPDVDTISDKLTADEAVEVIRKLQSENKAAATEGVKLPEPQAKINTATIIAITVAVIVATAVIAVAVVYIKREHENRRQNK